MKVLCNNNVQRMKNCQLLLLVLLVVLCFSSCTETKYMTRKSTLDKMVDSVKTQLMNEGYHTTGFSTRQANEMEVAGISYTSNAGFGTVLKNNFVTQDTYTFADTLGNTVSYSLFYALDRQEVVVNAGLCGCETSNPHDYDKVCGSLSQIDWMPNKDAIEVPDFSTPLVITGSAIIAGTILYGILRKR